MNQSNSEVAFLAAAESSDRRAVPSKKIISREASGEAASCQTEIAAPKSSNLNDRAEQPQFLQRLTEMGKLLSKSEKRTVT